MILKTITWNRLSILESTGTNKRVVIKCEGSQMSDDVVLNFIRSRFPEDNHWLDGNCFYFASILKARFACGVILYDTLNGHFVTDIGGTNYDWSGIVSKDGSHNYVEWDKFDKYDYRQKQRIERDCIR